MGLSKGEPQVLRIGILLLCAAGLLLSACAETQFLAATAKRVGKATATPSAEEPSARGIYKVGNPYQIDGVWYYPEVNYDYVETGVASWYGPGFHAKTTANGEIYDQNAMTAAHRTLPMPSFVRVTNLENGRSTVLRVNDRGPYARGRILDVSKHAAQLLGFLERGTARVRVQVLESESRAIAARMQNSSVLASVGTPIIVDTVAKDPVRSESLPPPPGAAQAPAPKQDLRTAQLKAAPIERAEISNPVTETVETVAVASTRLFVQAGAFTQHANAHRAKALLEAAGVKNVNIASVLVNDRDFYRVRVGPFDAVEMADSTLDGVIAAGYNDARIVVE